MSFDPFGNSASGGRYNTRLNLDFSQLMGAVPSFAPFDSSTGDLQPQILDELQRRRKQLLKDPTQYYQFADDPVGFNEVILRGFLWSKQREIVNALVTDRHVAVPSCHDVGKSALAARAAAWWLCTRPPEEAFVVTLAPTWRQVRAILWREINQLHAKFGLLGRVTQLTWLINEQLVGFGVSPADHDPVALQGIHAKYVLVIFDEACGIEKVLWEAAESLVANEYSRFLAIGNPDDPASYFAEVCRKTSGWTVIPIDAFASPNFTDEVVPDWLRPLLVSQTWVEERRARWGENSPVWMSKVRGQFPTVGEDTLFPADAVSDAMLRDPPPTNDPRCEDLLLPIELSADIARYGNNSTVITLRRGIVYSTYDRINNRDLMTTANRLRKAIIETGATALKLDDSGLGGGVTDRLKEMQRNGRFPKTCRIIPINFGEAPARRKDSEQFVNVRAQLYWNARELLTDADCDIVIPNDVQLKQQMLGLKYQIGDRNKIKLESKEDMRKRGIPSPDDADSLILAMAPVTLFSSGDWLKKATSRAIHSLPIFQR